MLQDVARVWPAPSQHLMTRSNNVARFCVEMLRVFGRAFIDQMTSKCGKNKKKWHTSRMQVSQMFLPHFDVFCDPQLNIHTEIWNKMSKIMNLPRSARLFEDLSLSLMPVGRLNWA